MIISLSASCKAKPATAPATPSPATIALTFTPQDERITTAAINITKYLIILLIRITTVLLLFAPKSCFQTLVYL